MDAAISSDSSRVKLAGITLNREIIHALPHNILKEHIASLAVSLYPIIERQLLVISYEKNEKLETDMKELFSLNHLESLMPNYDINGVDSKVDFVNIILLFSNEYCFADMHLIV